MDTPHHLAELEYIVLLTVARLGEAGYGMTIRREIERRAGRRVPIGSVYATLDRLERKGCVSSWEGEPTAQRGGRAKRHFKVEAVGAVALETTRRMLEKLWEGVDLDPRPGAA